MVRASFRTTTAFWLACLVLVIGCGRDVTAPRQGPAPPPTFAISDGAHSGGTAHFFFLPPMVSSLPNATGPFDGTLAPEVRVCEWTGTTCGALVAAFTKTSGTGGQPIRVDPTKTQSYWVAWDTRQCVNGSCVLDPAKAYRLRAFVGAAQLGFADVKVVTTLAQLKAVDRAQFAPLWQSAPFLIAFRIEHGAVAVLPPGGGATVGSAGGTVASADGQAALAIPSGALPTATTLSMKPATSYPVGKGAWSAAVDLGPTGTIFATPVTLTISYDPSKLPPGVPPSALQIYSADATGWQLVPSTVNNVDNTVSAPISHLSTYAINIAPNVVSGVPSPTTIAVGQTTVLSGYVFAYNVVPVTYCYWVFLSQRCVTYTNYYQYPLPNQLVYWRTSDLSVAGFNYYTTYTLQDGTTQSPPLGGLGVGTATAYAQVASNSALAAVTITVVSSIPSNDLATSCNHGITGIAFDGSYYYVGEGHDGLTQCITRYTLAGTKLDYKLFTVDIRGLHYVPATGKLVARTWGGSLYTVDYAGGAAPPFANGVAQLTTFNPIPTPGFEEGAPAADPDGTSFWILNMPSSVAERHRLNDNAVMTSFPVTGGIGGYPAIAATNNYVFVQNGSALTLYDKTTGAPVSVQTTSASVYGCAGFAFGAGANDDRVMYGASCGAARVERVAVPSPHPFRFASITAGGLAGCGVLAGQTSAPGTGFCWGSNTVGQAGPYGIASTYRTPLYLGTYQFASLSGGQGVACGVQTNGAAICWGDNGYGQLGTGTAANPSPPNPVSGNLQFASVSAGPYHACGITTGGAAYCWGRNDYGQLGNATQTTGATPVPALVSGVTSFRAVVVEELTTCALAIDGTAWCWGNNYDGRLGNGGSDQTNTPVQVQSPTPFVSITAGLQQACAVGTDHTGYCWGSGNTGELGNGIIGAARVPTAVTGAKFLSMTAGAYHTCGITTTDGSAPTGAACWGYNGDGRLGDGTATNQLSPVMVAGSLTWIMLSAGGATCGLATEGLAYCWGANASGELGNGTTNGSSVPIRVAGQ